MNIQRIKLILLTLLTTSLLAHAHAHLDHAEPRVGSTVTSPTGVKIWFSEKLNHTSSNIEVTSAIGEEVDTKDSRVDVDNPMLMSVGVSKLPPGRYTVKWNAVAIDTHHTSGSFTFDVKP